MYSSFAEMKQAVRWGLDDPDLMASVTGRDSYGDAVVAFFEALGIPVVAVTGPRFDVGYEERETFVTATLPDGVLGQFTIDEGWTRAYPGEARVPADAIVVPQGGRAARVGVAARAIAGGGQRFEKILSDPAADHPSDAAFRASVIGAWWKARVAEGHSEESARFLLALMVHPSVLALLRERGLDEPYLP
jgi:hypothetical protein